MKIVLHSLSLLSIGTHVIRVKQLSYAVMDGTLRYVANKCEHFDRAVQIIEFEFLISYRGLIKKH